MSVDTAQFVENAASCLTEKQLDYSGRVLYAGRALLVRGDVHIVGKNPGAWTDEKTSDDPTVCSIREDLRRWAEERPDDYCAPRDDSTSNPQLVKGCKAVLRFVGADPWRVVSSNVIFGRGALLTVIPRIISDLRLDEADRQRNGAPRDHPLRVCVALRVPVLIDDELSRILRKRYDEAVHLLRDHRGALERIAEALLERETLDGTDLALLVEGKPLPRLLFPVEVGADAPAKPSDPEQPNRLPGKAIPVPEPASS